MEILPPALTDTELDSAGTPSEAALGISAGLACELRCNKTIIWLGVSVVSEIPSAWRLASRPHNSVTCWILGCFDAEDGWAMAAAHASCLSRVFPFVSA